MLAVIRLIGLALMFIYLLLFTLVICSLRPFHRDNVQHIANTLGKVGCWIMGVKVELRIPDSVRKGAPFIYIANHQNSYDIFTMANAVLPGTVSLGKKSIKWIPVFGQVYWLSGNIMIDRKNSGKARGKLGKAVDLVREKNISIWVFPEGTRSNGKGLLPFKTGAFHAAIQANVPIVSVCGSSTCGKIKMNRWNNGRMIIKMLPPVALDAEQRKNIRDTSVNFHSQMVDEIAKLDRELNAAVSTQ